MKTGTHGAASLLLLVLSVSASHPSTVAAPRTAPRGCKRAPIGARPPEIRSAQDAANALRRKVNFRLWRIHRFLLSFFTTPFKRIGILGWTDYCSEACAIGSVLHADRSIDGIYTVDLALSAFSLDGEQANLDGPRYIRAEIFRRVTKKTPQLPHKGDAARICGKLMWDGDGFLEIHPRASEDIEVIGENLQPADSP